MESAQRKTDIGIELNGFVQIKMQIVIVMVADRQDSHAADAGNPGVLYRSVEHQFRPGRMDYQCGIPGIGVGALRPLGKNNAEFLERDLIQILDHRNKPPIPEK